MGPPGVGKGTQANIIKDKYDITHLSTGEILRNEIELESEIGVIAKKYIDDGLFVSDEILIKIIENNRNNKFDFKNRIPGNFSSIKTV